MNRELEIKLEILRKLTQVGPSYPLPESTLIQHVQLLVKPPPDPSEIQDLLRTLDSLLLVQHVPALLGGLKWRITEAGKAELAAARR
jgi:hypothetical protein